jgi:hypothetical protein
MRITQAYDVAGNPLVGTKTDDGIPIYNISDIQKIWQMLILKLLSSPSNQIVLRKLLTF